MEGLTPGPALGLTQNLTQGLTQTSHLWLFAVLAAGIIVVPGMDMAFVLGTSLVDGRRGGFSAVAGIVGGGVIHVSLGAAGVGLVLRVFPSILDILLYAGAAYVAWIGWGLIRGAAALGRLAQTRAHPPLGTFRRGFVTSLLNPKAYLFMIAVFPQFLRIEYGSLALQTCVLWMILSLAQVTIYGAIVVAAGRTRTWLGTHDAAQIVVSRAVGCVFIAAAVFTALHGWS